MRARIVTIGVVTLVVSALWLGVFLTLPGMRGPAPNLPALNGPPAPQVTPGSSPPAAAPSPSAEPAAPVPANGVVGLRAQRTTSRGLETSEDESEDEPASAEGRPASGSSTAGSSAAPASGGQASVPLPVPSLLPLPTPPVP